MTATYAYLLVQGTAVPTVLVNSVVVIVSFYFGTRGGTPTPTPPIKPPSRRPAIVRGLLLAGSVGLAAWFLRQNPSLAGIPADLLPVLEVLAGYILGILITWILQRKVEASSIQRRLAT